jgi:hypothetical protein
MLRNNGARSNGLRFVGGGSFSSSVQSRGDVGKSMANRIAFGATTSYPVGYYERALKLPFSVGQIASTFRTFGSSTATGSIQAVGSIAGSVDLTGLITTSSFLIAGSLKSGAANGVATCNTLTLFGRGAIGATLNIGFKPSAYDIAQEVWGAIASLNNVIGTMGEVLNSATGGGGGGASASSIATAVWDRLLSGHTTTGSAGKALADAGGGSSPTTIASAVRTELSTELGRIDTTVSSRLASAGYTAPDNLTISTINTKLGTPATSVSADIASRASQTSVNAIPTTTLLTTDLRLDNLDAAVSSRLATASYSAPISASTIATQVRTELGTELSRIDTTISSRNAVTPPTVTQIRTELDTNSTKLDASISTRLASGGYTAPDNATISAINTKLGTPTVSVSSDIATRASQVAVDAIPTTTLLSNDSRLNNLDATISSRLAGTSYTIPPSVSAIRSEIDTNSTKLDVAISTRLASGSYTTPPTASVIAGQVRTELGTELTKITAIPSNPLLTTDSRLNSLDATISSRLATSSYTAPISAATIANAVWTAVTRSLNVDVTISSAQITQIAVGVEAAILNEADGQQVVDAIVTAIGNTNITSGVIASAVRSELATELARIDVATSTRLASSGYVAPNNSAIVSILEDTNELQTNQGQWLTATGFATPTNVSNAQTAIISEINANETKLDSIKAKTDILVNTDLSEIEADLVIINEGVKKASLLIPHSEDL